MTDYKSMFEQAVRTLAAIDEAMDNIEEVMNGSEAK